MAYFNIKSGFDLVASGRKLSRSRRASRDLEGQGSVGSGKASSRRFLIIWRTADLHGLGKGGQKLSLIEHA